MAPTRIGEHRCNLVGLCADGPTGDHCLQRRRRSQKRRSESGGRSVDDDEVGGLLSIEFFDLAQHQQVLKAGCGGGNHVERGGRRCLTQQSADALQFEVVAERLGGRNRATANATLAFECSQHSLFGANGLAAEQWSQAWPAIDCHEQHIGTLTSGNQRKRCGNRA